MPQEADPDFHIDLGDTFAMDPSPLGTGMTDAEAKAAYFVQRPYMGLIGHSIPIFLVLGNHENEEGWNFDDVFAAPDQSLALVGMKYRKLYYPNPIPDGFYTGNEDPLPTAIGGDTNHEDYYAWTWGDALFVVLDPYHYSMTWPAEGGTYGGEGTDGEAQGDRWDWTLGREQYDWFKDTLENSDAKYKFVFIHHVTGGDNPYGRGGIEAAPYFEWGGLNWDGTPGFADNRPGWGAPIHQVMVDNGVTAFFHGHDHAYAYEALDGIVYQECPKPDEAIPPETSYLVESEANGGNHYPDALTLPASGHMRVTVSPSGVTVEYVRTYLPGGGTNGEIADSYVIPNSYTLTYTAGAGGSITGLTPQTVAYGADGTAVTAVADPGYHFVRWSDGVLTGSRTDFDVMADFSVSAEFAPNTFSLTATAPSTAGPFSQGSVVPVAFDVAFPATTGWFHTYAFKDSSYHWLNSQAADGSSSYGFDWTVTQPIADGYVVRVWYVDGSGNWLVFDDSSPTFAITAGTLPVPSVTQPSSAGPFAQGDAVSVAFTVTGAPATGMFHTYAYKDGTYYWLDSRAASGAGSYSFSWKVTQPVGTGYVVRTWYVDGSGNWIVFDDSSPTFAITPGTLPVPSVTQPSAAGPFAQGDAVSVAFTVTGAPVTGMFHTYAFKDGSYYWLDSRAASGASSYSFSWNVTQPVGTGYVVRTWYVDGDGNWIVFGDSSPEFSIGAGTLPVPAVTLPNSAGPFDLGSIVPVAFDVAFPATTGWFHTYAYKDGSYHWLDSRAASGAGSYGFDWTVAQPVAEGYVIRVWYVDGSGNWLVSGDSSPGFAIE